MVRRGRYEADCGRRGHYVIDVGAASGQHHKENDYQSNIIHLALSSNHYSDGAVSGRIGRFAPILGPPEEANNQLDKSTPNRSVLLILKKTSYHCLWVCRRSRHRNTALSVVYRLANNGDVAPARRVALKIGRRPRCSSVTYRFRYAPSRLAGGPF